MREAASLGIVTVDRSVHLGKVLHVRTNLPERACASRREAGNLPDIKK